MPNTDRYFELVDTVDPGQPLQAASFPHDAPALVKTEDGQEIPTTRRETIIARPAERLPDGREIRVIPGTRYLHASDPIACGLIEQHPLYREIDPPQTERKQPARPAATPAAAAPTTTPED